MCMKKLEEEHLKETCLGLVLIVHRTGSEDAQLMQEKQGYIDLMLALFRTISFPTFEQLHIIFGGAAGFTPLLPSVLNLLCAMLEGPNSAPLKHKIIEACLITPARHVPLTHIYLEPSTNLRG